MLEKATSSKVNELIRIIATTHIKTYENGQPVSEGELKALAELIAVVDTPEQIERTPAIGFVVEPSEEDDDG